MKGREGRNKRSGVREGKEEVRSEEGREGGTNRQTNK